MTSGSRLPRTRVMRSSFLFAVCYFVAVPFSISMINDMYHLSLHHHLDPIQGVLITKQNTGLRQSETLHYSQTSKYINPDTHLPYLSVP
jgi:hypothetical protein